MVGQPESEPAELVARLEQRLLGGRRRWRRREVARAGGVSLLSARKLWRALGFANVSDDDVAFTDADVAALKRTINVVRQGLLDEPTIIALARALGQTTDRLASWQTEAVMTYLESSDTPQDPDELAQVFHDLVGDLEVLMVYAWRRRIADSICRLSAAGTAAHATSGQLAVGFADLVSYTRLAQELEHQELGRLVQRFEGLASDVITAGAGRVIKTVGDEVLFTTEDPVGAVVIALSLSERMSADDLVPEVRVGLAYGMVLRSLGDVYGPTVNLASRLTAQAHPGTVVTDPATAGIVGQDERFVLLPQRRRILSGLGQVQPLLVERRTPGLPLINVD
jgi:adenylate cyclase